MLALPIPAGDTGATRRDWQFRRVSQYLRFKERTCERLIMMRTKQSLWIITLTIMFVIVVASCAQLTTEGTKGDSRMNGTVQGIGTGVLLQHGGQEYVVTALHVAEACGFEPFIDINGMWTPSTWEVIGSDSDNDIAVLRRVGKNDDKIARLTARYGKDGIIFGAMGTALGFPGTIPPIEWVRYGEHLRPFPIPAHITLSFGIGRERYYTGGYLNHGFSGGPIVAWSGTNPIISGIITSKAYTIGLGGAGEHAGLVGITDISVAERIIAEYNNQTIEVFQDGKPMLKAEGLKHWSYATLVTAEIMDSVVRLGMLTDQG